jgi:BlaI family penicillinase repressor
MPRIPRISEAEWEVLAVLWRQAPLTATQVFASLATDKTWKLNTVRTFLSRLEKKGVLRSREGKDAKQFLPAISREACVRQESESFLARVFDGGTAALLLHFARSKRLSTSELAELEAILAQKRTEKR